MISAYIMGANTRFSGLQLVDREPEKCRQIEENSRLSQQGISSIKLDEWQAIEDVGTMRAIFGKIVT